MKAGLVERTVELCRALRERGFLVTTSHASDAVRALAAVGVRQREDARLALRCVLASRPEEFEIFDELFAQLFAPVSRRKVVRPQASSRKPKAGDAAAMPSLSAWGSGAASDDQPEEIKGASEHRGSGEKDFASFGSEELEEIERIARRIARRLAARPSRRWKACSSGGELIDLRFRRRKLRKTRVVALCDVSGSMDLYSRLLLQFLYALQGSTARVESFVFSTELRRVTEELREREYAGALRELSAGVHDWSGGTRIGESLKAYNDEWGRRALTRGAVVVVLSDGCERGEADLVGSQMARLARQAFAVVWVNPLRGHPEYEPLAGGMRAALPHVDRFLAGHDVASLESLGKVLGGIERRHAA
jgi:uncharacterized protein with von Willebrand factor type A (vWA) domain